jgi:hypothetical protein
MEDMLTSFSQQMIRAHCVSKDKLIVDAVLSVWPEFSTSDVTCKDRLQHYIYPDKTESYAVDGTPVITFQPIETSFNDSKWCITQKYRLN